MTRAFLDVDEMDVQLEAFEEPLDELFPRLPNVVSHRGHKVKLKITIFQQLPPAATSVRLQAEVLTFGPERIGNNQHVFRHSALWGRLREPFDWPLMEGHAPPYRLYVIVQRQPGDEHLGQGPYEAFVSITPQGEGLINARTEQSTGRERLEEIIEPKVSIRFTSM